MIEVIQSAGFSKWMSELRDVRAKARIAVRIDRMASGNLGDVKAVGEGLSEARIAYGPGYRLYFLAKGDTLIVMLAGGDKSSQSRDIAKAKELAKEWR
jgi:putative addiction module killer protein